MRKPCKGCEARRKALKAVVKTAIKKTGQLMKGPKKK